MISLRFLPFYLAFIAISSASAQTIKCATVDLNKLIIEYHVAKKEISALELERIKHQTTRKERSVTLAEVEAKIKTLIPKLRAKDLEKTDRDALNSEYQDLSSRYKSLSTDLRESDQAKIIEIRGEIAVATRRLLDEINVVIAEYAKENKYHWVIETSGVSNTKISPLIYARETTDITDAILALINKDAPVEKTESE